MNTQISGSKDPEEDWLGPAITAPEALDKILAESIRAAVAVKQQILVSEGLQQTLRELCGAMIRSLRSGGKILFCGNGGSAADAQHLAAELSGRFYRNRPPLYADVLHGNSSYLTAVANDFSYADTYARLVEAMGRPGDILVALSTSGQSENILRAVDMARTKGMRTVGMTGEGGGLLKGRCDYLVNVPSRDTPRIQEAHMLLGHALCQQVEAELFDAS